MKPLTIFIKLMYWVFPMIVIPYLSFKWDSPLFLLGIVFSIYGSLGRILEYVGLPIFSIALWAYFQYINSPLVGSFTFFGLCLLWGYSLASIDIWYKKYRKFRRFKRLAFN